MSTTTSYKAREFNLSGLNGISDETLEMHFKLYEGYVKETNKLTERITKIHPGRQRGPGGDACLFRTDAPARF